MVPNAFIIKNRTMEYSKFLEIENIFSSLVKDYNIKRRDEYRRQFLK
jgi:hypothetical protein